MKWTQPLASSFLAFMITGSAAVPVFASDCSAWPEFHTRELALAPHSLQLSDLQNVLNAGKSAEGMIFDLKPVDRDVWMDVTYAPGNAAALAGMRSAFMAFRLLSDDFENFVFSDGDAGIYKISEPVAREIGCQFIWGREGGQNPIHLMRVFYKGLQNYDDNQPAVVGFNGSLLGDTNLAIKFNNEYFVKSWILTAVQK